MLQQLSKRRVLRVLSGYCVVCFVILQIADVTFEPLDIDNAVLRGVIAVMVISFPIVAYLAWIFDVEGSSARISSEKTDKSWLELSIAIICTVVLSGFMWWHWQSPREHKSNGSDTVTNPSIVVLPFANLSADPEQEYFSDGLTEELMSVLARLSGLRVISRTSAFSFKSRAIDTRSIAQELNVSYVLEGSVRSNGNELRITAQLIDAHTDAHLWSATFDRTPKDVFSVQDEISNAVAKELQVRLLPTTFHAYTPSDPEVHRAYLRARHLIFQFTETALSQARVLLEHVVQQDPLYSDAWKELGRAYINEGNWDGALEASQQAVTLDADGSAALLAWIAMFGQHNIELTAQYMQSALSSSPSDVDVLRVASRILAILGKPEDVIRLGSYLEDHDPYCLTCLNNIGAAYLMLNEVDQAETRYREILNLGQGRVQGYYSMGIIRLLQDRPQEALELFQQEQSSRFKAQGIALALDVLVETEQAARALDYLIAEWGNEWPDGIAAVYAWTGETDEAFAWLSKRDSSEHNPYFGDHISPLFRSLHSDQRWQTYLTQMGLADDQLARVGFKTTFPN